MCPADSGPGSLGEEASLWGEGLYLALERSGEAVRGREALFQPCGPGEEAGGRPVPGGGEP